MDSLVFILDNSSIPKNLQYYSHLFEIEKYIEYYDGGHPINCFELVISKFHTTIFFSLKE